MMAHLNPGAAVWLWVAVLAAFATTAMSQAPLIPSIPASQKESSSLVHLWEQALRNQGSASKQPAPKTYLAPLHEVVHNWVPQGSSHPLYTDQYADLLREIILDYMVQEKVEPDDPRMTQPNGLQVTNLNGNKITFTRDAAGIKVNEKRTTTSKTNTDGTASYVLDESLFGHRQRVQDAWKKYTEQNSVPNPFGEHGIPPPPPF